MADRDCIYHKDIQGNLTLQDVANQPREVEPTMTETQAAVQVLSRVLHHTDNSTITVSTGGRVRYYTQYKLYE